MIHQTNNLGAKYGRNGVSLPSFMKTGGVIGFFLVQALISCNSSPSNKDDVKQPSIEVVEPPKPVETHKPFIVNGKEIGSFLYRDNYFAGIIGLKDFHGSQDIWNDSMQYNGEVHYLLKDGVAYLFPAKSYIDGENNIGEVVELKATGIQPLTASTALVTKGDKSYLYTASISSNGNSLSLQDLGEINDFVSLTDSTIGDIQHISEFPQYFVSGVLLTNTGKKYYLSSLDFNHKPTEILDVQIASIQDKKEIRKTLLMTENNSKKYALGSNQLIPYDKVGQTLDGQVAYTLDGNLISFGVDTYFGGEVAKIILAIKSGKIKEYAQQNQIPEKNRENSSLTDAINKNKPTPSVLEYKDVSKQFAGFKVRYIGIIYGEGEDYTYSSDGRNFYYFNKAQEGSYVVSKVPYVDNIVSITPLSDEFIKSKKFTGNYFNNSILRYIGIQEGCETVEYTIQGAEGNKIQTGDEVQYILTEDILEAVEGYTPKFYYKDGSKIKKLEANTLCPQGTKIIIRYSK